MTSTLTPDAPSTGWHSEASDDVQFFWDGDGWAKREAARIRGSARWAAAMAHTSREPFWKRPWFIALCVVALLVGFDACQIQGSNGGDVNAREAAHHSTRHHSTLASKADSGVATLNPRTGVANTVQAGSTFVLGSFRVRPGWQIENSGFGMGYGITSFQVVNVSDESRTFAANVKLHRPPDHLVANLRCIATSVLAHHSAQVSCMPDGARAPYDKVTIENTY